MKNLATVEEARRVAVVALKDAGYHDLAAEMGDALSPSPLFTLERIRTTTTARSPEAQEAWRRAADTLCALWLVTRSHVVVLGDPK